MTDFVGMDLGRKRFKEKGLALATEDKVFVPCLALPAQPIHSFHLDSIAWPLHDPGKKLEPPTTDVMSFLF